ncbi:MAG: hypothetical protein JNJ70_20865 [Verrucomicrobiales bacterium]|nr:hypothetical protein [Verrucomicrobiales bacterium]
MKRIETKRDHALAVKRLEQWMLSDPEPGDSEEAEFVELAIQIEAFERDAFPIPKPTAEGIAEFRRLHLDQSSL